MKLKSFILIAVVAASIGVAHAQSGMNWPSMTMSFKAKDKAMLQKVKPGDQVEFSFVKSGKDQTITEIK